MQNVYQSYGTGLPGLDRVLTGLRPGDNVVWQVDSITDYLPFVRHFCREAVRAGQHLVYFRFARHKRVLPRGLSAEVVQLHPEHGFEEFIGEVFDVIERVGVGGYYVFDCLSDLLADWYSDRMLANFFRLTCPYLYEHETAAYFGVLRDRPDSAARQAMHGTAQVVMDVYRREGTLYVHPLKVYKRHSDTMYMLHAWRGDTFTPVTESAHTAEVLTGASQSWLPAYERPGDVWTRTFREAAEMVAAGAPAGARGREQRLAKRITGMVGTRDARVARLAERYLDLTDWVGVGRRLIGTGLIGGKALGMLIARGILQRDPARWMDRLEQHDSFFIGSDVFYTYLIENGCWWVRRQLRDPAAALDRAQEARQRLLSGSFPQQLQEQFIAMLEYFGQSPIVVRSSSLLEDAYGDAFSGKYETVYCANQGTPTERLERFVEAVRTVYASTMSREALSYRARRGLLERDEQMALLVQRVSGQQHGTLFFPEISGIAYSWSPYVWSPKVDPRAGFARLAIGLGTRATAFSSDDAACVVSLNAPECAPTRSGGGPSLESLADVLDLRANQPLSRNVLELAQATSESTSPLFEADTVVDESPGSAASASGRVEPRLRLDRVLTETSLVDDLRVMVATLECAYEHPVDVEFTVNFSSREAFHINVLQCRPFKIRDQRGAVRVPKRTPEDHTILSTRGPIIGAGRQATIGRIVYVVPDAYRALGTSDQYAVAKLLGRVAHLEGGTRGGELMLVGPGRWGTSAPALGVPVSLTDVDTVRVLCEVAFGPDDALGQVSLGTHFFTELVELDVLYLAIYPEASGSWLNTRLLKSLPNRLQALLPDAADWSGVVRVIEFDPERTGQRCRIYVNALEQTGTCILEMEGAGGRRRARATHSRSR